MLGRETPSSSAISGHQATFAGRVSSPPPSVPEQHHSKNDCATERLKEELERLRGVGVQADTKISVLEQATEFMDPGTTDDLSRKLESLRGVKAQAGIDIQALEGAIAVLEKVRERSEDEARPGNSEIHQSKKVDLANM